MFHAVSPFIRNRIRIIRKSWSPNGKRGFMLDILAKDFN